MSRRSSSLNNYTGTGITREIDSKYDVIKSVAEQLDLLEAIGNALVVQGLGVTYVVADNTARDALTTLRLADKILVLDNGVGDWEFYTITSGTGLPTDTFATVTNELISTAEVVNNASSDANIKTAYENNADTNAFTDAEKVQVGKNNVLTEVVGTDDVQTIINKTIADLSNDVHANVTHLAAKATEPILKGQAVVVTGYNVGLGALNVALANQSTGVATAIAGEDIDTGVTGMIHLSGVLEDIDTTGATLSAGGLETWNEADILYVGNGGYLTNVEPTTGITQPVAYVLRKNVNNGAIQLNVTYPKQQAYDVRYDNTTSTINSMNVQDAIDELVQMHIDTNEPNGFIREFPLTNGIMELCTDGTVIHRIWYDGTHTTSDATHANYDATITPGYFYDGTVAGIKEFAIHPVAVGDGGDGTYTIYIQGIKFVISNTQKVTLADISGLQFVYHNASGSLAADTTFSFHYFEDMPITSVIYGNTISQSILVFGDERHGVVMDGYTHQYLHFTQGFKYFSGMEIQGMSAGVTTYTQITSGAGYDEDIYLTAPQQSAAPFMYLSVADWDIQEDGTDVAHLNVGVAQYNQNLGTPTVPNFTLTDLTPTQYGLMFFAMTNNRIYPYIKMVGQTVYSNALQARSAIADAWNEILVVGGLPFPEFTPIGAVIVNSAGEVQLLEDGSTYYDLRKAKVSGTGAISTTATYHQDLLDRDVAGAHPSTAITYDNTTSGLTATTVKTAIDEIEATTVHTTGTETITGVKTFSDNVIFNGGSTTVNSTTVTTADNLIVINSGEVGTGVTAGEAGIEVDRGVLINYGFIFDETTDSFRIGEHELLIATDLTGNGTAVTVTTSVDHPFSIGDSITIEGSTTLDGTYTIDTTPSTTTFTFLSASVATGETGLVRYDTMQKVATREDTPLADGVAEWDATTSKFKTTQTIADINGTAIAFAIALG